MLKNLKTTFVVLYLLAGIVVFSVGVWHSLQENPGQSLLAGSVVMLLIALSLMMSRKK